MRRHSRIAIAVGVTLYVLSSFLDSWFVPEAQLGAVNVARWTAMVPAILTFFYTYSAWFRRINSVPLALVGVYAAGGIFGLLWRSDERVAMYYNAALVLVILFTYSFVGARFIHALSINLLLVAAYNLIFGLIQSWTVGPTVVLPIVVGRLSADEGFTWIALSIGSTSLTFDIDGFTP